MADELRKDRSKPKLAQAITLYHLVIEAALAQPGQHLIEESLKRRDLLPGFREGIGNVSKDEQRHIAFGVKLVADLVREDPACGDAVEELLREVFPYTAAVFIPPGWDERYIEVVRVHARGGLCVWRRRARIAPAGCRLRSAADASRTAVRRSAAGARPPRAGDAPRRISRCAERAGHARPCHHGAPVRRAAPADGHLARPGARIQWEFDDAEPWHVSVENGAAAAAPGQVENPDLVFRCRFQDWIDVTAGRTDPLKAVLTRKIRPSGKLRMLIRAPKLFG